MRLHRIAGRSLVIAAAFGLLLSCAPDISNYKGTPDVTRELVESDYTELSLQELRKNPATYLFQRVEFTGYFVQTGSFYVPFFTPFDRQQFANFQIWEEGARLWREEDVANLFPLCYVLRDRGGAVQVLENLKKYDIVRIRGLVRSAHDSDPWIEVEHIATEKGAGYSAKALRHIKVGLRSAEEGNYDLAARRFQYALDNSTMPRFARGEVSRHLGLALFELERYDQAEAALNKALEYRRDPLMLMRLGQAIMELTSRKDLDLKRLRQAQDMLNEAVAFDPGNVSALASLGLANGYVASQLSNRRARVETFERAERYCNDALQLQPTFARAIRNLAVIYRLQGDIELAIENYKRATAEDWDNPLYWRELAQLYMDLAEEAEDEAKRKEWYQQAVNIIEPWLQSHPEDAEFRTLLSKAYVGLDKLDLALSQVQQALDVNRDYRPAYLQKARVLQAQNQLEPAEEALQEFFIRGLDAEGYLAIINYYEDLENYDKAIEYLDEMLADEQFKDNETALFHLGMNLTRKPQPDRERAIKVLERLLQVDKGHIEGRYWLADNYRYFGRFREADTLTKWILDRRPKHAEARILRGRVEWHMGQYDKALEDLKMVVERNGMETVDYPTAHYYYALVLTQREQYKQAANVARQLVVAKPDVVHYRGVLGYAGTRGEIEPPRSGLWEQYMEAAAKAPEMKHWNQYFLLWYNVQRQRHTDAHNAWKQAQAELNKIREERREYWGESYPLDWLRDQVNGLNRQVSQLYRQFNQERPD